MTCIDRRVRYRSLTEARVNCPSNRKGKWFCRNKAACYAAGNETNDVMDEAEPTISGIELRHRFRNAQFELKELPLRNTTAPAVWTAVLSTR
jgi:hypothetical protein